MGEVEPAVSLSEAQAFLRLDNGDEEAVLAALTRSATALCEAFLGQALITRAFEAQVEGRGGWQRLPISPLRSITEVRGLDVQGNTTVLPAAAYAVDIDAQGDGWLQVMDVVPRRLRVAGMAGLAVSQSDVPEPIRQGILRLVAHLFNDRDGAGGEPPAAVTALWRPFRRMRLG